MFMVNRRMYTPPPIPHVLVPPLAALSLRPPTVGKYFFGSNSKESVIDIPAGQFYIVRPLSLKAYSELIYKDAKASLRRTGTEFQYQLVVTRVYEEGEAELLGFDSDDEAGLDDLNKDEQSFLLDQALQFRVEIRDTGEKVFAWRDLTGAGSDLWEFVCDVSIRPETVESFHALAVRCQYERKYLQSGDHASEEDLAQFLFTGQDIPTAGVKLDSDADVSDSSPPHASEPPQQDDDNNHTDNVSDTVPHKLSGKGMPTQPPTDDAEASEAFTREVGELHLFDVDSGTFTKQDDTAEAVVLDLGDWNYWLKITGRSKSWIGRMIENDINPVFNFEYQSAIFNVYDGNHSAYSWLLRFKDEAQLGRFQQGLMQALWEHNNQVKWAKLRENHQDYVLTAFNDLTLDPSQDHPDEVESEEDSEEEEEKDHPGPRNEEYDSDESQDDVETQPKDDNTNSQLAVGQKNDRAFVIRGSKIGVFKHNSDNNLEFVTNINKVATPKGRIFSPKKVMLHASDANMVLQDSDNPNSVFRMDLEVGKIVDEWKVHDDIPINTFAPESKFAQMTDQQTFLGFSKTAMYRVDPRLAGNKLVDTGLKQYATKTGFTTAATTERGHIAVGSDTGDIRLYDRLGIIAKTALPGLGIAIIGIDVSADGHYVLATTATYLLLIDTKQKSGKYTGSTGFERSFPKDAKPEPRRLALSPAHTAQFMHETTMPISFTSAKFNTGIGKDETTIVTSTGPFVVSWSMKKVLNNQRNSYSIKRYADEVKADDFRFDSDKGIIVALPNEVDMVMKKTLKAPTRESIAGPSRSSTVRTLQSSARRSYLSKNDIVETPY